MISGGFGSPEPFQGVCGFGLIGQNVCDGACDEAGGERAKAGRCEGRKPFGHYPGERRAIERMRALRNDGAGYQRIAEALDSEGLPTRKGSPWQPASVRRILLADQKGNF